MPRKSDKRGKESPPPKETPKPVALTGAEKAQVEAYKKRLRASPEPSKWKSRGEKGLDCDRAKGDEYAASAVAAATGTVEIPLSCLLIGQATNATLKPSDDPVELGNAITAAMAGIAPQNEMEGLLVAQMVSAHNAALECLRRAHVAEQTSEGRKLSLTFADRFMRTYAVQVEALARLRKGGQQKVVVEHVHVYPGGQAIVGNVNPGGRDGMEKTGSTPCPCAIEAAGEAIPFCPGHGEAVRSAMQADGSTLPSTGDAERSL
jgi:hypothetical protein